MTDEKAQHIVNELSQIKKQLKALVNLKVMEVVQLTEGGQTVHSMPYNFFEKHKDIIKEVYKNHNF